MRRLVYLLFITSFIGAQFGAVVLGLISQAWETYAAFVYGATMFSLPAVIAIGIPFLGVMWNLNKFALRHFMALSLACVVIPWFVVNWSIVISAIEFNTFERFTATQIGFAYFGLISGLVTAIVFREIAVMNDWLGFGRGEAPEFQVVTKRWPEKIVISAICVLSLGGYFLFHAHEENYYLGKLPKEIGTTGTPQVNAKRAWDGGCGVVVFRLSETMLNAVNHQGLKYFDHATEGRYEPADRLRQPERTIWGKWAPTPVPLSSDRDGISWEDLYCGTSDHQLSNAIRKALKTKGAYYTPGLAVIPKLGIAVLSHYDP